MKSSNKSSTSIKNRAVDDRPREKLLSKGRESLSDSQLLAILISTGSKNKSAVELAKEMLALGKNNLTPNFPFVRP
jgi:DNA repair protein RadC